MYDNISLSLNDPVEAAVSGSYSYCGNSSFITQMQNIVSGGVVPSGGHTYYVATDGSDDADGSQEHPYQTINRGLRDLVEGDTLMIRGGTYYENIDVYMSGDSGHYITIENYPSEEVILSGEKMKGADPMMMNIGGSYLCIRGLKFMDLACENAAAVNMEPGANHIILAGLTIENIRIPKTNSKDSCANAILIFGDSEYENINNVLIYDCFISDCDTGYSEAVSVTGNVSNINVVNNTIDDTHNIGIDFSGNYGYCPDDSLDHPRKCLAAGNVVKNCVADYATSYGIYVDGGQDIMIEYNEVSNCGGGIEIGAEERASKEKYQTQNIKVINNLLSYNIDAGMAIGGYKMLAGNVDSVTVKHNVCQENGLDDGVILSISKCSNIDISYNKFVSNEAQGGATIVDSQMSLFYTKDVSFSHNTYSNGNSANDTAFTWLHKNYTKFADWVEASGDEESTYDTSTSRSKSIDTSNITIGANGTDSLDDTDQEDSFWLVRLWRSIFK